jgi:hypothetical protein
VGRLRLPVHRLLSGHRHHPPRLRPIRPARRRLRRAHEGARRCRGHRSFRDRRGCLCRPLARRLGFAYPDRVDKLVYLDAADLSERFRPDREEPAGPPFADDDLGSLRAFQSAVARFFGHREPKAALCDGVRFDPSGRLLESVTPDEIGDKISADVAKQPPTDWLKIGAPRLGIYRAWLPIVAWHVDTVERFHSHDPGNPEPILRELRELPTTSTSPTRPSWSGRCGNSCWATRESETIRAGAGPRRSLHRDLLDAAGRRRPTRRRPCRSRPVAAAGKIVRAFDIIDHCPGPLRPPSTAPPPALRFSRTRIRTVAWTLRKQGYHPTANARLRLPAVRAFLRSLAFIPMTA